MNLKKKKTKARSEEWRYMHLKMVNVKQLTKPILKKKKKQNKTQEGSAWQQASIYVSGWHAQQRRSLQKREKVYKHF